MIRDAWRLALGTLTAVPVQPPTEVTPTVAGRAMLLAPFASIPLGVLVGAVLWVGPHLQLAPLLASVLAVGVLALGSRAFHLDGLSDVADGLTASYDARRSLEVMKSGSSGPAGTVALIVVLGGQVAALSVAGYGAHGWLVAGALVCLSRAALSITCAAGVPGARSDGLGTAYVGSVPVLAAVGTWAVVLVTNTLLLHWAGWSWTRGPVVTLVAIAVVVLLVQRAVKRFGGVTGDVFGAAIEITLLVLLAGLA